jgi:protein-tyrosine kinase
VNVPLNTVDQMHMPSSNQRLKPIASMQQTRALQNSWTALRPVELGQNHLAENRIFGHKSGVNAMPYDMLRTRLVQYMRDKGWRRVAITSPTAECGKSTVALNLALSLQRQPECRTMLLEMDMHRPSVANMLGAAPSVDLAHFLRGERLFNSTALRVGENLAIAANCKPATDVARILASRFLPLALSELEATYAPDIMVFDTPPMLLSHDMMAIAKHVDCVLVIAAAELTTSEQIDQCERELSGQTQMLGVILNKCHHQGPGYGYGGYE